MSSMQSYQIVVPKSVDEFHHRAIIITFDSDSVDEYTFKEELVRAVRAWFDDAPGVAADLNGCFRLVDLTTFDEALEPWLREVGLYNLKAFEYSAFHPQLDCEEDLLTSK